MQKNTVSIALDGESQARFARLLGNYPLVTGAHCTHDDDEDVDGVRGSFPGAVASGAHCSGDDDVDE